MQVRVAVNGGEAIIDIPDSVASNMSEAQLTQWIAQNVDRSKTRAGTIIPMADPSPYPVQQYQTPVAGPAPAPTAGQEDVYEMFNSDVTPLPPEQGYTGFMRQVPGLIMDGGSLLTSNPLYAGLAGGTAATIGGSKFLREGSVTPLTPSEAGQKYRKMHPLSPKKMFMADPDALRGAQPVIDQFNKTAPTGLLPGAPIPEGTQVKPGFFNVGFEDSAVTYNQAGADMQNKLNLIAHSADFAKNYGIKLPDVEAKIKAGDMDGALNDIYKAIEDHQKTSFGKIGEKISSNYKQGGAKQVAQKAGQKALDATKNLPKNAITATGNLLNKNALTRGAGGALAVGLISDAATSLKNIGREDALEEQAKQAKELRKFAEDRAYSLGVDSEELKLIREMHANPKTRHLLYQR